MIARGATALCEALDTNGLNESENHHFLGDILRVFVSLIAGLRVNAECDSPSSLLFAPTLTDRLTFAKAEYDFPSGRATVGWERCGDGVRLYADVPKGVRGVFEYDGKRSSLLTGYQEFLI